MGIDGALVRLERDAVQRVQQLAPGEDAARLARERGEQRELGRGQVHGPPGHLGPHAWHVQRKVAGHDAIPGRGDRPFRAPEHGADARHELAGRERLGEVVVRPELQAQQLVEFVVAGSDHHDRDRGRRRVGAQVAGDVEPIESGQAEVQDDEVGAPLADRGEGAGSVAHGEHREPGMLEIVAGEGGDPRFVIDDEDGLHGRGGIVARPEVGPAGLCEGVRGVGRAADDNRPHIGGSVGAGPRWMSFRRRSIGWRLVGDSMPLVERLVGARLPRTRPSDRPDRPEPPPGPPQPRGPRNANRISPNSRNRKNRVPEEPEEPEAGTEAVPAPPQP